MISAKNASVRFKNLTPAMAWMLYRLESYHRIMRVANPPSLVITSMNDGKHMEGSKHYNDEAIDIRTHNFESREQKIEFCLRFADFLGPKFSILLENEGKATEHIHVQVKKGLAFFGVE